MVPRSLREAFFIASDSGADCFALLTHPTGQARGALIYVHPFAEEMNKSRRMVALAARALAEDGWAVLQTDLSGCGDSSGDLQDFSWDDWLDDLSATVKWADRHLKLPVVFWGLRAGCLLIADWMRRTSRSAPVLFWQPVMNGKQHLTQFLRIKAASEMLTEVDARSVMSELRARLDAGDCVEVAGYTLCPALAQGMSASTLGFDASFAKDVIVVETCSGDSVDLSPALKQALAKWDVAGLRVSGQAVGGAAFWSTVDIMTVAELTEVSRRLMSEVRV